MDRRAFVLGLLAAGCSARSAPHGQGLSMAGEDAAYLAISADRNAWGKVIHIHGDSISRGYGLGVFADTVTEANPLYALASIRSTANWVLSLNGALKYGVFGYAGPFAVGSTSQIPLIAQRIKDGIIRAGDVVIVEDAGDHSQNPDQYEAWWAEIRLTVTAKHNITLVMMNMFDYPGSLGSLAENQYDTVFGSRTMNQATVAAATADQNYVGQTILLDMNAIMDAKRAAYNSSDGLKLISDDGIHPNVWGQTVMVNLYLRASGLRQFYSNVDAIKNLAAAQYLSLRYGSSISSARASQIMGEILLA